MDSVEKKIERIVRAGGEGKVYFPSDFFECGSDKAVSKALQRLVANDVLMRMMRGLYCYPYNDTMWGMGRIPAGADDVLKAYMAREGFKIGPCFGEAQNALGLSEQVVMNPVFSTDGPSRVIPFRKGRKPIVLIHVPPRVFNYKCKVMMMAEIALANIGKDDLWQFDMERFESVFSRVPYEEIRDDLRIMPSWMRNLILGFYGKGRAKN